MTVISSLNEAEKSGPDARKQILWTCLSALGISIILAIAYMLIWRHDRKHRDTAVDPDVNEWRRRRRLHLPSRSLETRPTEGLNELGEVPPPYNARKPPGTIGDRHEGANEPRISGMGAPPEYPAQPSPTHAANPRNGP
ncbi:hypothetical protein E4U22_004854 [Claviceps purpurea]|nr:hypothetical protein E4U12_004491 [Claviceps purpurea]KAG6201355.1 hypothetical protein E4U35_005855 [Claviceps purpurea]KAG6206959.1 hypothetical protein E4U50_004008 [Claviceps purpurea]KAG6215603.1 hypothetical protein E4U26_008437 [Claviceps purpurea]KAG6286670.1 hypothetical protein E4U46_004680 [Claviceps purpurea]